MFAGASCVRTETLLIPTFLHPPGRLRRTLATQSGITKENDGSENFQRVPQK